MGLEMLTATTPAVLPQMEAGICLVAGRKLLVSAATNPAETTGADDYRLQGLPSPSPSGMSLTTQPILVSLGGTPWGTTLVVQ